MLGTDRTLAFALACGTSESMTRKARRTRTVPASSFRSVLACGESEGLDRKIAGRAIRFSPFCIQMHATSRRLRLVVPGGFWRDALFLLVGAAPPVRVRESTVLMTRLVSVSSSTSISAPIGVDVYPGKNRDARSSKGAAGNALRGLSPRRDSRIVDADGVDPASTSRKSVFRVGPAPEPGVAGLCRNGRSRRRSIHTAITGEKPCKSVAA